MTGIVGYGSISIRSCLCPSPSFRNLATAVLINVAGSISDYRQLTSRVAAVGDNAQIVE